MKNQGGELCCSVVNAWGAWIRVSNPRPLTCKFFTHGSAEYPTADM